jgi:hypothetical protein
MMVRIRSKKEIEGVIKNFQKFEIFSKLISKQFSNFFSSYTQSFNKVYSRTGNLFQSSMKKKEVINDAYFTQLILYIHNNPVKHGFVKHIYDWPFSSIHQLTHSGATKLNKSEAINWFGDLHQFKQAHQNIEAIESVFD